MPLALPHAGVGKIRFQLFYLSFSIGVGGPKEVPSSSSIIITKKSVINKKWVVISYARKVIKFTGTTKLEKYHIILSGTQVQVIGLMTDSNLKLISFVESFGVVSTRYWPKDHSQLILIA